MLDRKSQRWFGVCPQLSPERRWKSTEKPRAHDINLEKVPIVTSKGNTICWWRGQRVIKTQSLDHHSFFISPSSLSQLPPFLASPWSSSRSPVPPPPLQPIFFLTSSFHHAGGHGVEQLGALVFWTDLDWNPSSALPAQYPSHPPHSRGNKFYLLETRVF